MKDFASSSIMYFCVLHLIEMEVWETQRHLSYVCKYPQEVQRHLTSLSGFVLLLELRKKALQHRKWMLIGGFGLQWRTHTLIWFLPSNVQRYFEVNIIYFWTLFHFLLRPQSFKRLFYLYFMLFTDMFIDVIYNLQFCVLLNFCNPLLLHERAQGEIEYVLFNILCTLLAAFQSCWGEWVNSWDIFSSCFVRWVAQSTSADFSIHCCAGLLFLWRCVSVGVERSEFMHMHFVPHSCLNLEPLGDQLQPYLKRGEGGWLGMEVSCRVGTVRFSCEWRCFLSCLGTVWYTS